MTYRPSTFLPHDERIEIVHTDLADVELTEPYPLLPVLDSQFGSDFTGEVTDRMIGTTHNNRDSARDKLSNCLSYLFARTVMENPRDDLVANLGPDEAWHTFIVYMDEYDAFCRRLAGDMIHHDPAGESALVNTEAATAKTVGLFEQHGIPYTEGLWQDHITYPNGAVAIRSGFTPRSVAE